MSMVSIMGGANLASLENRTQTCETNIQSAQSDIQSIQSSIQDMSADIDTRAKFIRCRINFYDGSLEWTVEKANRLFNWLIESVPHASTGTIYVNNGIIYGGIYTVADNDYANVELYTYYPSQLGYMLSKQQTSVEVKKLGTFAFKDSLDSSELIDAATAKSQSQINREQEDLNLTFATSVGKLPSFTIDDSSLYPLGALEAIKQLRNKSRVYFERGSVIHIHLGNGGYHTYYIGSTDPDYFTGIVVDFYTAEPWFFKYSDGTWNVYKINITHVQ